MLAPIAVTYEYAMTQGEGRNTWRTDNRYSPCPRTQAGEYLAFLASIGYTLTPIEQAVADGVPWTGDTPTDTLTTAATIPPAMARRIQTVPAPVTTAKPWLTLPTTSGKPQPDNEIDRGGPPAMLAALPS